MNALEEAENLVDQVVPEARAAKWLAPAIAAVIALVLIGFAGWWIFIRPAELHQQVKQAEVNTALQGKAAGLAISAMPAIADAARQKSRVDDAVSQGFAHVDAAPEADGDAGGVTDALRNDVCLYDLYANSADCGSLPADPAEVGPAR